MFDKSSNSYSIERQTLVPGQYLFGICLFLPTKKKNDILQLISGHAIFNNYIYSRVSIFISLLIWGSLCIGVIKNCCKFLYTY